MRSGAYTYGLQLSILVYFNPTVTGICKECQATPRRSQETLTEILSKGQRTLSCQCTTNRRELDMKSPILMDFPESFETERLLIRSPLFGDGPELHAAVRVSMEELTPWMPCPKEHRTIDDSEASARRARVAATSQKRCEASRHSLSTPSGPDAWRSDATPETLPAFGSPGAPAFCSKANSATTRSAPMENREAP
jgi:hypothetical protein